MTQYYSDLAPLKTNDNIIINGDFDVWQRGTSFIHTDVADYTADRWWCDAGSVGAAGTFSRQTFSVGQTNVPGEPQYNIRFTSDTAAGSCAFIQPVEDVRRMAGRTFTLSFYCYGSTAMTGASISIYNLYNDDPSENVYTSDDFSVGTSWSKKVFTFTMPSLSGKSIGASSFTRVYIRFNPVEGETANLSHVKLEEGSVATEFYKRPYSTELALCQRYFQVLDDIYSNYAQFGNNFTSGQNYYTGVLFFQEMRIVPTLTVLNVGEVGSAFNGLTTGSITIAGRVTGARWMVTCTTTSSSPASVSATFSADAEF